MVGLPSWLDKGPQVTNNRLEVRPARKIPLTFAESVLILIIIIILTDFAECVRCICSAHPGHPNPRQGCAQLTPPK